MGQNIIHKYSVRVPYVPGFGVLDCGLAPWCRKSGTWHPGIWSWYHLWVFLWFNNICFAKYGPNSNFPLFSVPPLHDIKFPQVIVITHAYGPLRRGIRYLCAGSLRVYYLPCLVIGNCYVNALCGSLPWFRRIFLRERIQILHCHSVWQQIPRVLMGKKLENYACFAL